ncbi:MAG: sugar nucleotide-binding protein, partial [Candidatus Peribacteraceae bacterium]|nr:sugar nucleotide-binding protein [Candidatus Peribacteraceae bacterium]
MTKVLIFGGGGYLGGKLCEMYPDAAAPKVDIADPVAVRKALDDEKPDTVINAAGKTGKPNVDWCEDHKEETLRANVTGPLVLLEECMKRGIYFVHVGSGCIFTGARKGGGGYTEEDEPNFTGSFYSLTKAMSDRLLKPFPVLQLRIRMPFDGTNSPRNLLTKLRGYKRVLDAKNSITYMPDFFEALKTLVAKRATGIYNVVNPRAVSPYDIMVRYKNEVDPSHEFERISV